MMRRHNLVLISACELITVWNFFKTLLSVSTENMEVAICLLCLVGQIRVIISCLISFVPVIKCEFKGDSAYKSRTLPFRTQSRQSQCKMVQHIPLSKNHHFFHKSKNKRNLSLKGMIFSPEDFSTYVDPKKHYRISIFHGTDASRLPM